jgi:hypothetical protein
VGTALRPLCCEATEIKLVTMNCEVAFEKLFPMKENASN